jgi:hypothetical protein
MLFAVWLEMVVVRWNPNNSPDLLRASSLAAIDRDLDKRSRHQLGHAIWSALPACDQWLITL